MLRVLGIAVSSQGVRDGTFDPWLVVVFVLSAVSVVLLWTPSARPWFRDRPGAHKSDAEGGSSA